MTAPQDRDADQLHAALSRLDKRWTTTFLSSPLSRSGLVTPLMERLTMSCDPNNGIQGPMDVLLLSLRDLAPGGVAGKSLAAELLRVLPLWSRVKKATTVQLLAQAAFLHLGPPAAHDLADGWRDATPDIVTAAAVLGTRDLCGAALRQMSAAGIRLHADMWTEMTRLHQLRLFAPGPERTAAFAAAFSQATGTYGWLHVPGASKLNVAQTAAHLGHMNLAALVKALPDWLASMDGADLATFASGDPDALSCLLAFGQIDLPAADKAASLLPPADTAHKPLQAWLAAHKAHLALTERSTRHIQPL